jgi:hypothetical protein
MPRIFLSYRRNDTKAITRQMHEVLSTAFGPDSVFIDFDSIPGGANFSEYISAKLEGADILLVVIGPHWLERDPAGRSRLMEPNDFVRLEIVSAIKHSVQIVPVLVGNAQLPNNSDLPEEARALLSHNAVKIDDGRDFHIHLRLLTKDIERLIAESFAGTVAMRPSASAQSKINDAQPQGILLDRHYSYALTTYCASGSVPSSAMAHRQRDLFDILTSCLILYDQIHIEQNYVSSIAWSLDKKEAEAFSELFVPFTFDSLHFSARDKLLLDENIAADLDNAYFRREIERYYEGRVIKGSDYREIVAYINKALLAAKTMNWAILPWSRRANLFNLKLSHLSRFGAPVTAIKSAGTALDVLIPDFRNNNLDQLLKVRSDGRLRDFRKKLWDIAKISADIGQEAGRLALQECMNANRELVRLSDGRVAGRLAISRSVASPLPTNPAIDIPVDVIEDLKRDQFSWLFFVYGAGDDR